MLISWVDPPQRFPKPLDLFDGIVVHRSHTHHATRILQPQAGGDLQGVIILKLTRIWFHTATEFIPNGVKDHLAGSFAQ